MKLREAKIEDSELIIDFIHKLAIYEKLEHEIKVTKELIEKWIFKEKKGEVLFIIEKDKEVGFVLYFYNFSTFVGKPGIYIEDIFILEEYRGNGYGKEVFKYLAKKSVKEGYGRIEWTCLDWNKTAINFYEKMGAVLMDEWTNYRLNEKAIIKLANS